MCVCVLKNKVKGKKQREGGGEKQKFLLGSERKSYVHIFQATKAHKAAPTPEPSLASLMWIFLSPSAPNGDNASACLNIDLKPG